MSHQQAQTLTPRRQIWQLQLHASDVQSESKCLTSFLVSLKGPDGAGNYSWCLHWDCFHLRQGSWCQVRASKHPSANYCGLHLQEDQHYGYQMPPKPGCFYCSSDIYYRQPNWPHDDHQDSCYTPSCQNCLDQRCLVNLVMNIAWCAVHSSILYKSSRESTSYKQVSLTDVAYMEDYSLATCPVLGYSNQSWNQCQ